MDPKVAAAALAKLQAEIDRLEAIEGPTDADEQRYELVTARLRELSAASPEGARLWDASRAPDTGPDPAPVAPTASPAPPAPPPAQPPPAPAAPQGRAVPLQAQPPPKAAGGFGAWLGEGLSDFGRSLGGLAQGAVPAAVAAALPEVDDGTGIPRRYAAGSAEADMTDQIRRDQAQAEQRSPIATGVARGLSAAAQVAPIAAAAPVAGTGGGAMLANTLAPAVGIGALSRGSSAVDPRRGFGDWLGEVADPNAVATDATVGLAAPAVVSGVADVAAAAAPPLRSLANRTRAAASGAYGGELKKLREAKGPQAADELGEAIERTGIRPQGIVPKSARSYMEGAERVKGELGDRIGKTLETADDLNVRTPRADIEDDLLRAVRARNQGVTDDSATSARTLGRVLDRTHARYGDQLKPTELHTLKREAEKAAGFKPGTVRGPRDSAKAEGNQDAADVFRRQLDRAVNEQIDIPEVTNPYNEAMRDYGFAADAGSLASKRVDHELGNQILSLPTFMGAITGAGAGGSTGSAANSLIGAGIGGGSAALLKLYGKDGLANTLRGMQHGAEGVARAADATLPTTGSATGAFQHWLTEPMRAPATAVPLESPDEVEPPDVDQFGDEGDAVMARRARRAKRLGAERQSQ